MHLDASIIISIKIINAQGLKKEKYGCFLRNELYYYIIVLLSWTAVMISLFTEQIVDRNWRPKQSGAIVSWYFDECLWTTNKKIKVSWAISQLSFMFWKQKNNRIWSDLYWRHPFCVLLFDRKFHFGLQNCESV